MKPTPARIHGEPYTDLPADLYIPPDALEVFLETFEGPLDLLLYLIKRQNLNILDIPIAEITHQYMSYIAVMEDLRLELAAEYLVMAAMLAEIKSRLLLPRPSLEEGEGPDPRTELVRRLQEYERFKRSAEDLDDLPRLDRDIFTASAQPVDKKSSRPPPEVGLADLLTALQEALQRCELYTHHHIQREPLSVRERMSRILEMVDDSQFTALSALFTVEEGRRGVVVSLLAVLELIRESLLELVQARPFAPIYVRLRI